MTATPTLSTPDGMRVLHVTLSFSAGGRRQAIATLSAGLAQHGVRSYLCCLDEFGASADELDRWFAHSLQLQRRRLLDFAALCRLRQFCQQHHIDVLHAHDAASEFTCTLAMPWSRTPLVMSFHRSLDFESARVSDRVRNAIAGLRASAVVTASEQRRQHYLEQNHVAAHKVVCIPLGIDLQRFRPQPACKQAIRKQLNLSANTLLVGVVGHFGTEKGVDVALDAFQIMCRNYPEIDADLLVLGSGAPERIEHIQRLIDPALRKRVHMLGFQPQPEQWIAAFDVLLHAARTEAFGLVLVEAMACAVPVIAAAVGGIPDIVRDRECGRLLSKPDASLLATALSDLLMDADERARMAQGALQRAVTDFDQHIYVDKFESLYKDLLSKGRPAG